MAIYQLDPDSTKLNENAPTGHSVKIGQMIEADQKVVRGQGSIIVKGDDLIFIVSYGTANLDIPTLFVVKLEFAAGVNTAFYEELFGADTVDEAYEYIKDVLEKRAG